MASVVCASCTSRRASSQSISTGERLRAANLCRQLAVARRLAGLPAQAVALRGDLRDHVVDAHEIVLGALQPQLGLVAARVQAGDARRLLQDAPARLRLGRDDLRDLPLPHEGRRARAGRGVGEQDLHVAGAHLAAVDAVGRALLARDAPRDLDDVGVVEGGRRRALGVVQRQPDLGDVARDLERVFALFPRLRERTGQVAGTMSGGEQQMVALGRALMAHPAA